MSKGCARAGGADVRRWDDEEDARGARRAHEGRLRHLREELRGKHFGARSDRSRVPGQ